MMRYILVVVFMLFGSENYETQKYDLLFSEDDFEIRYYPASLKAKVVSNKSANGNFYKLFQFISGNNSKGEKIEMTTPVYMKNDDNSNTMEFVMPASYDLETISSPNDKNVVIYESEAKHFACIRYGGYSNSGPDFGVTCADSAADSDCARLSTAALDILVASRSAGLGTLGP